MGIQQKLSASAQSIFKIFGVDQSELCIEQIVNLLIAGKSLQDALGSKESFLNAQTLLTEPPKMFLEFTMTLLVKHNIAIPHELASVESKPYIKIVFIAGLIDE